MSPLDGLGWGDHFAAALTELDDPALSPGRVAADYGSRFLVETAGGSLAAVLVPRLRESGRNLAVGDWVALRRRNDMTQIEHLLPRRSVITRKAPSGSTEEQVLAANVDTVLVTTALGTDFNLRRIERLLTLAYQSGALPVVLLTKSDLEEPEGFAVRVAEIAPGVPVLSVSALSGRGLEEVRRQVPPGKTAVLIGSSGVGKSTLINRLLGGEVLKTASTHRGGQGRHTTSHRQLLQIPHAGLIIDTPGLREVQLWAGENALGEVFADVEALAADCRFADCGHEQEPDCAVRAAIEEGRLEAARFASYRKLQRELRSVEVRADVRLQIEERRKWKAVYRAARERTRAKRRLG